MPKRERDHDDTPDNSNNNNNKKPLLQHKLRGLGDGTQVRHTYTSRETIADTYSYMFSVPELP